MTQRARFFPCWLRHLGGLLLLAAVAAAEVAAAPLATQPLPVIELGMHTAEITAVATDRTGRWAVTASADKTARVWDIATGSALAVLRPPQGSGNEGKLYAVALSPDGVTVALGGWLTGEAQGFDIVLMDGPSGRLLRRIGGLPSVVNGLAFSPDGRLLAAAVGTGGGVHLFDAASGRAIDTDAGYQRGALRLQFSADGRRLVSTGLDGGLRIYDLGGGRLNRLAAMPLAGGREPFQPSWSPDGRFIAVGYADTPVVQVLDAQTGAEVARPVTDPLLRYTMVAWSRDGAYLYGAGLGPIGKVNVVRQWPFADLRRFADSQPVATNTVTGLVALPDGRMLYASMQPSWGVVNTTGQVQSHHPLGADFRLQGHEFRTSADGRRVRFSHLLGSSPPRVFDLQRGGLGPDDPGLPAPRVVAPGLRIDNWLGRNNPSVNGRPLPLQANEVARCLDTVPGTDRFVLGTDWGLLMFNAQGQQIWRQEVPAATWAVAVTGDRRHVVAGHGDGSIRWRRIEDGREVLALFLHTDRQRWVAWTPEGYFDASPGGEQLIGFHLNRGRDQAGEFVSAAQLRERFLQPGLVARRLEPGGDALVAAASAGLGDVRRLLAGDTSLPPEVELLSQASSQSANGEVVVTVRLKDRGGGVGGLSFFLDGKPMEGRQAGVVTDGTVSRSFVLPPGRRRIEVAAVSRNGVEGRRVTQDVLVSGTAPPAALHILAVGVEKYRDTRLELRNSASDAVQLAAELAQRAKPLFTRGVKVRVLKDGEASLDGIQAAFDALRKDFQADDTLVIFLAGHGETARGGGYVFLPWEFNRGAAGAAGQGLDEARLQAMLKHSPPKTLLLFDTCEAGGAEDLIAGAYRRLNSLTQHVLIGASRKGELAREGYEGHGVFTAALLETLRRKPDDPEDKVMTVLELSAFVEKSVDRISRRLPGYQQKVSGFMGSARFPIVAR